MTNKVNAIFFFIRFASILKVKLIAEKDKVHTEQNNEPKRQSTQPTEDIAQTNGQTHILFVLLLRRGIGNDFERQKLLQPVPNMYPREISFLKKSQFFSMMPFLNGDDEATENKTDIQTNNEKSEGCTGNRSEIKPFAIDCTR